MTFSPLVFKIPISSLAERLAQDLELISLWLLEVDIMEKVCWPDGLLPRMKFLFLALMSSVVHPVPLKPLGAPIVSRNRHQVLGHLRAADISPIYLWPKNTSVANFRASIKMPPELLSHLKDFQAAPSFCLQTEAESLLC